MKRLDTFFHLTEKGATLAGEVRGGCTTFFATVYLAAVIPGVLSGAGMDFAAVMTATCLIAGLGSIAAGLWSNSPFVLAPGLGFPTLFTYTICQQYVCT